MQLNKSNLKIIKGDASFRSFYRKTNNKKTSIIVYAQKEKEKEKEKEKKLWEHLNKNK